MHHKKRIFRAEAAIVHTTKPGIASDIYANKFYRREMAQPERTIEQSQEVGLHARTMQDSNQLERGMEDCKITKPANSTVKRYNASLWVSDAIRGFRISRCT